jgi:hypothetical protein
MLRGTSPRVKAATAIVALWATIGAGFGGCYWYRYGDLMRTHMDVLAGSAGKLCSLATGGGVVRGGEVEYAYPLQRARDFARVAAKRCPDRASLARFRQVMALYGEIVARAHDVPDRACAKQAVLARRIKRVEGSLAGESEHCG